MKLLSDLSSLDNVVDGTTRKLPTKTSDLINDSGFITSIPIASASSLGGIKVGANLTIGVDRYIKCSKWSRFRCII